MPLEIPHDVEEKYEGRWVAWDTDAEVVLADGESMDEILDATRDEREAGRLIWYHNVLPRDLVIVGGL